MAANFTPDLKPYTGQGKFRYWVQMVLPTIYDDSLSYMELLNKLVYVINLAIEDVDAVEENVASLLEAFNELQQFTNDYFNNLDVQEEINIKLDEMVESGEFTALIEPLFNNFNNRITILENRVNQIEELTPGSTTGDAELQDIRISYDGNIFPVAGINVRTNDKINHDDIIKNNLECELYDVTYTSGYFISPTGVITQSTTNFYKIGELEVTPNVSKKIKYYTYIYHESSTDYSILAYYDENNNMIRKIGNNDLLSGYQWVDDDIPVNTKYIKLTLVKTYSNFPVNIYNLVETDILHEGFNLNNFTRVYNGAFKYNDDVGYVGSIQLSRNFNPDNEHINIKAKFRSNKPIKGIVAFICGWNGTGDTWSDRVIYNYYTTIFDEPLKPNEVFTFINNTNSIASSPRDNYGVLFEYASDELDAENLESYIDIIECKINDGDYDRWATYSARYYNYNTNISNNELHSQIGINPIYNKRIGFLGDSLTGAYYKNKYETWTHIICERNNAIEFNYGLSGSPIAHVENPENPCMIDRYLNMDDNLDIIFVMGGANDYNHNVPIGENNSTDITTFKGALNTMIEGLINKYPKSKIIFATTYRRTANYNDKIYADAMLEICGLHSIKCINNYTNSGVHFFNAAWMQNFGATGSLGNNHLNKNGDLYVSSWFETNIKMI